MSPSERPKDMDVGYAIQALKLELPPSPTRGGNDRPAGEKEANRKKCRDKKHVQKRRMNNRERNAPSADPLPPLPLLPGLFKFPFPVGVLAPLLPLTKLFNGGNAD